MVKHLIAFMILNEVFLFETILHPSDSLLESFHFYFMSVVVVGVDGLRECVELVLKLFKFVFHLK